LLPSTLTLYHSTQITLPNIPFFFNTSPPTQIYPLSLTTLFRSKDELSASYGHDVDKLFEETRKHEKLSKAAGWKAFRVCEFPRRDRKSTRLNSSHVAISYAVFCLKKKKNR